MAITLNPGFTQPSAAELNKTAKTLTMESLSADLKNNAVNINPAVVYHPSGDVPTISPNTEVISGWIGRPQAADFEQVAARHAEANNSLKLTFESFKASLSDSFPELADKKFGFTIEADGNLKVLNTANELSAADMDKLNTLLNDSDALKAAASGYRDASIELVAADSGSGGSHLGKYNLTKDNFASTIDLAALFVPKGNTISAEAIDGYFSHQLWRKGQLGTPETDAAIVAARDAKRIDEKV